MIDQVIVYENAKEGKQWTLTVNTGAGCAVGMAVVAVWGERGGLKARLAVDLHELQDAIARLG